VGPIDHLMIATGYTYIVARGDDATSH
jgi:hypothetical protein